MAVQVSLLRDHSQGQDLNVFNFQLTSFVELSVCEQEFCFLFPSREIL